MDFMGILRHSINLELGVSVEREEGGNGRMRALPFVH
jgi:hypothetical protein